MLLRDEHLPPATGLDADLRASDADIVPHSRIRQLGRAVLVRQSGEYPSGRVSLLPRRRRVLEQHRVDRRLEHLQPRRGPDPRPSRWRVSPQQRSPNRRTTDTIPTRELPNRQALHPRVASDQREQLHPRPHLKPPPSATEHRCHNGEGRYGLDCPEHPVNLEVGPS